jgi:hypothetical protein
MPTIQGSQMTVNAPLNTVQSVIDDVRTLLLDKVAPYRYTDDELITALNTALLDGKRYRADLYLTRWGNRVPWYTAPTSEPFCIEDQFRLAFVFATAAHAMLRDSEDVPDQRATSFQNRFQDILTGAQLRPIVGGTPAPRGGSQ